MRILLVDDSQTMRSITRAVLAELGAHEVKEAGDGREAVDVLATFVPDLILCDWSMPVMDGLEFVQHVRTTDRATPIIMVTTESELAKVTQAIRAGVNHYVVKPFTPSLLRKRIDETLRAAAGPDSGRLAA